MSHYDLWRDAQRQIAHLKEENAQLRHIIEAGIGYWHMPQGEWEDTCPEFSTIRVNAIVHLNINPDRAVTFAAWEQYRVIIVAEELGRKRAERLARENAPSEPEPNRRTALG